jgi:hypothetical protein
VTLDAREEIRKLKEANRKLYKLGISKSLNDYMASQFKDTKKNMSVREKVSVNIANPGEYVDLD